MQSKWKIMTAMLKLVRPLWAWMVLAVLLGVAGFFCSILITVLGTYGLISLLGLSEPVALTLLFALLALFGIGRGLLRYGEQACNHYIAFKLLALIRDHVFTALRRLCPAKLEGRGKGDLISMLTSDVELLEVFYAHTISPVLIALIMSVAMSVLIGMCIHCWACWLCSVTRSSASLYRCASLRAARTWACRAARRPAPSAASCWSRCAVWMKRSSMATVKHAQHS